MWRVCRPGALRRATQTRSTRTHMLTSHAGWSRHACRRAQQWCSARARRTFLRHDWIFPVFVVGLASRQASRTSRCTLPQLPLSQLGTSRGRRCTTGASLVSRSLPRRLKSALARPCSRCAPARSIAPAHRVIATAATTGSSSGSGAVLPRAGIVFDAMRPRPASVRVRRCTTAEALPAPPAAAAWRCAPSSQRRTVWRGMAKAGAGRRPRGAGRGARRGRKSTWHRRLPSSASRTARGTGGGRMRRRVRGPPPPRKLAPPVVARSARAIFPPHSGWHVILIRSCVTVRTDHRNSLCFDVQIFQSRPDDANRHRNCCAAASRRQTVTSPVRWQAVVAAVAAACTGMHTHAAALVGEESMRSTGELITVRAGARPLTGGKEMRQRTFGTCR